LRILFTGVEKERGKGKGKKSGASHALEARRTNCPVRMAVQGTNWHIFPSPLFFFFLFRRYCLAIVIVCTIWQVHVESIKGAWCRHQANGLFYLWDTCVCILSKNNVFILALLAGSK
jgi:hypothetical protein